MDNNHPKNFVESFRGLISLALLLLIIALGSYAYLTLKEARYVGDSESIITVSGKGEVLARPDIAAFNFAVIAEEEDAAAAKEASAEATNAILAYLKDAGVAEKDIKTQNYNLSPQYDYVRRDCTPGGFCPGGEQVLRGFQVNQTVRVKVRAIDDAGELISGVSELGATNVSSLSFTIDDDDALTKEARAEAIADAKAKANELAKDLGVRLVRITGFWENQGGDRPVMFRAETMAMDTASKESITPEIPVGENTFVSEVSITYEVR